MSWGLVAVAGATVVSGAMSANQASKARKSADKASGESLAFDQQKYDDWLSVYGPIQDNLSAYYTNISPEYYETQGLEAFEEEYNMAIENINEMFAQRGIVDSGLALDAEMDAELLAATERAKIRTDAPRKAAEEKLGFLQVGLGVDPSRQLSQSLSQRSNRLSSEAAQQERVAGEAIGTAITTTGTALADYFDEGQI